MVLGVPILKQFRVPEIRVYLFSFLIYSFYQNFHKLKLIIEFYSFNSDYILFSFLTIFEVEPLWVMIRPCLPDSRP